MQIRVTSKHISIGQHQTFPEPLSLTDFAHRVERITGIAPSDQTVSFFDANGVSLTPQGEMVPAVTDHVFVDTTNPSALDTLFEDDGSIVHTVMDDEAYDKRQDSAKKFLDRMKTTNPSPAKKPAVPLPPVGARCQVMMAKGMARGTVLFGGVIDGKPGEFVGVCLDEPLGKNDGSVDGKRYFEAHEGYGVFVRADKVECGDFPPLDDEWDEI